LKVQGEFYAIKGSFYAEFNKLDKAEKYFDIALQNR
jgi:hypothetical protein